MRITKIILLLFFSGSYFLSSSQNYFQQEVNYIMNVRLDDVTHELYADETIEYVNNSPDKLNEIWFHLWPNAYKDNSTALAKEFIKKGDLKLYQTSENERGYIDQLDFKVNAKQVHWELHPEHIDICRIILNEPLLPAEKIIITTPFHVKIPAVFSRFGHDEQSYQISQWYPKPAVYDKNGWNYMPYLDQGEFYSEFGSFDVSITLPRNYVVGATGELINEEEKRWLDEKVKETEAILSFSESVSFPESDTIFKTLRYKQSNIHDFAWFADKRYHVLQGEVELPHSKRKVTTWSMFTNSEAELWKKSIAYVNNGINFYSLKVGDYPYSQATAVQGALGVSGAGGMEYPMITVVGRSSSSFMLEQIIVHEIGHNWFYGILGSNERIHPWMDEGINTFYETMYSEEKTKNESKMGISADIKGMGVLRKFLNMEEFNYRFLYEIAYLMNARRNLDQPIELPAYNYTNINYGGIVYGKTSLIFDYLEEYLGEEVFDKAMQQYFETWKFKHPQPQDLRKIFEEVSSKNLDWFFNDLINTNYKIDYKITSQKKVNYNYEIQSSECFTRVIIKNKRQIKAPYSISTLRNDSIIKIQWFEPESKEGVRIDCPPNVEKIKIDAISVIPEINRQNNTIRTSGIFKKVEPLKFKLIAGLEDPSKTQIFYSPVFGWNKYNKFMLGGAVYNSVFPVKPFEYIIMPLYGFGSKTITGGAMASNTWYPANGWFRNINFGVNASSYAYATNPFTTSFLKFSPRLSFELRNKSIKSTLKKKVELRSVAILKEEALYSQIYEDFIKYNSNYTVNELVYSLADKRKINPYNFHLNIQQGEEFVKTSIEANYKFSYKDLKKGCELRLFVGKFIYTGTDYDGFYSFKLSGFTGTHDYLFDEVFLGRSEWDGLLSQQFLVKDGGFKMPTPLGRTADWLLSLNLKISFPGKLPLGAFISTGTYAEAGKNTYSEALPYEIGVYVPVIKNIFEIYFPITYSKDIKDNFELNNINYARQIRFELNLSRLNPFVSIKNSPF